MTWNKPKVTCDASATLTQAKVLAIAPCLVPTFLVGTLTNGMMTRTAPAMALNVPTEPITLRMVTSKLSMATLEASTATPWDTTDKQQVATMVL